MSNPSSHDGVEPTSITSATPAEVTYQSLSLEQLVDGIIRHHRSAETKMRAALEDARVTGDMLRAAQRRIPYGSWTIWVQQKLPFSVRTANNYIRIARAWPRLPDTVGSIEGALDFLAARTPLPAPTPAELPPPATPYEAAVREAAALWKQIYERELATARIVADLFEKLEDDEQVEYAIEQLRPKIGNWRGWLWQIEDMISGPDDELGREYLRLLKYKSALLSAA